MKLLLPLFASTLTFALTPVAIASDLEPKPKPPEKAEEKETFTSLAKDLLMLMQQRNKNWEKVDSVAKANLAIEKDRIVLKAFKEVCDRLMEIPLPTKEEFEAVDKMMNEKVEEAEDAFDKIGERIEKLEIEKLTELFENHAEFFDDEIDEYVEPLGERYEELDK